MKKILRATSIALSVGMLTAAASASVPAVTGSDYGTLYALLTPVDVDGDGRPELLFQGASAEDEHRLQWTIRRIGADQECEELDTE